MNYRYAEITDLEMLCQWDHHVSRETIQEKIAARQILIAERSGQFAGWLRFGLFWDEIPFCNLLFLQENFRGQGIGSALMGFWEWELRLRGYSRVLVSTQSDEAAQLFYRRLGYRDIGGFVFPGEPFELLLFKEL